MTPPPPGRRSTRSLAAAREQGLDHEVAFTLHASIRLASTQGIGPVDGAEQERDAIMRKLDDPRLVEVPTEESPGRVYPRVILASPSSSTASVTCI